jgi:hypothetical protein
MRAPWAGRVTTRRGLGVDKVLDAAKSDHADERETLIEDMRVIEGAGERGCDRALKCTSQQLPRILEA